jgi:hypothetical protein
MIENQLYYIGKKLQREQEDVYDDIENALIVIEEFIECGCDDPKEMNGIKQNGIMNKFEILAEQIHNRGYDTVHFFKVKDKFQAQIKR